jgi:hypothetical protein
VDAFYMDRFEATTGRYAQFLGHGRRATPDYWDEVAVRTICRSSA